MDAQDRMSLNAISALYRMEPHRVTPREGFYMMFKQDRVPGTGEPLGAPYLNPQLRAMLERQGHDADEFAAKMEQKFREDGIWPTD